MSVTYDELRAMWPRDVGQENLPMRWLVARLEAPDFNPCPDYQRVRVWSPDQSARFIGFMAEGGDVPPLYVQRWSWARAEILPDELVDGLQRVTAVQLFMSGAVPMELSDGRRVYLRDMSERDQHILTGASGPMLTFRYVQFPTRAEVLRFYIRLNRGGTPHSDAEIDRVRALLAVEEG